MTITIPFLVILKSISMMVFSILSSLVLSSFRVCLLFFRDTFKEVHAGCVQSAHSNNDTCKENNIHIVLKVPVILITQGF